VNGFAVLPNNGNAIVVWSWNNPRYKARKGTAPDIDVTVYRPGRGNHSCCNEGNGENRLSVQNGEATPHAQIVLPLIARCRTGTPSN
jgi:hypothetical protein